MASYADAKPAKPASRARSWSHKHQGDAYVAKLVEGSAICHFVQSGGSADQAVAGVASRQLGLITIAQLSLAGLSRGEIASRLRRRILHRLHRGVYLVGHTVPLPGAGELAAVLACGETAAVSHRSAAALWRLAAPPEDKVTVTVEGRNCKSRAGIRVHRVERLDER